jgi:nucleotide-binding universal stress UspA family protein
MTCTVLRVPFRPVVVLPTYNNSGTLEGILQRVQRLGLPSIVVNDGSTDDTAAILAVWQKDDAAGSIQVIQHPRNTGKGAALQTAFQAAAASGYTHSVTMDTDGQLNPEEIPRLLDAARRNPDALVIGVRNARHPDYPAKSRWGRMFSNFMIWLECGQSVADSQCGFRVYPMGLTDLLRVRAGRFGYEAEIVTRTVWAGCSIVEVPVNCRYFPGKERVTHFRPWVDSLRGARLHGRLIARAFLPLPHRRAVDSGPVRKSQGGTDRRDTPPGASAVPLDSAADVPPSPESPVDDTAAKPRGPSRVEAILAFALLALCCLLRIGYIFSYSFSSNESQHLHVAWGWAHGLMQYRDVFDNHSPLFHLLSAPLVRLFGERADLLILMRFAMFPLYLLAVWFTYAIARPLFSQRVALWAAVCTGLFPVFFLKTVEYRTDDLWTVWWLGAMAILLGGRLAGVRSFLAGLFVGAAFATSMKTSMLFTSFGAAALSVLVIRVGLGHSRVFAARHLAKLLAGLLGLVAIPAILIVWFYSKGALGPLYYGTIGHNLLSDLGHAKRGLWPLAIFVPAFCILWLAARNLIGRGGPKSSAQAFVLMGTVLYLLVVELFWPLITLQDFLPVIPFVGTFMVAGLDWLARRDSAGGTVWGRPRRRQLAKWAPALIALLALGYLAVGLETSEKCQSGQVERDIVTWAALLDLTTPADTVLDPKGELIFRRRATYWGFETITRKRLQNGLIADTIAEDLVANRTCVVWCDARRYPDAAREFIASNYVDVGPLLVAGQILARDADECGQSIPFDVRIPAQYALVGPHEPASGLLDGVEYGGPIFLPTGHHEFRSSSDRGPLVLIWEKSIEKGFSPFGKKTHALRS